MVDLIFRVSPGYVAGGMIKRVERDSLASPVQIVVPQSSAPKV
jgi:hypothetical protein